MCKSILPTLQDEFAHLLWEAEHLSTVHSHHGDHHAEEKTIEAAHEENEKQNSTTKAFEPVCVHIAAEIDYHISRPIVALKWIPVDIFPFSLIPIEKNYPPPRHC